MDRNFQRTFFTINIEFCVVTFSPFLFIFLRNITGNSTCKKPFYFKFPENFTCNIYVDFKFVGDFLLDPEIRKNHK